MIWLWVIQFDGTNWNVLREWLRWRIQLGTSLGSSKVEVEYLINRLTLFILMQVFVRSLMNGFLGSTTLPRSVTSFATSIARPITCRAGGEWSWFCPQRKHAADDGREERVARCVAPLRCGGLNWRGCWGGCLTTWMFAARARACCLAASNCRKRAFVERDPPE